MKKILLLFAMVIALASCSSNDDEPQDCLQLIEDGVPVTEQLISTALNFTNDPTIANCTAYAAAIGNYLDYFEDITSCFENAELDELVAQFSELRDTLGNLTCN